MHVMCAPAHGDVRRRAEDEVTEASLCQLEVEVAEDARNFLERLDDRRLELMDRGMIDVIPRLVRRTRWSSARVQREAPPGRARESRCGDRPHPIGAPRPPTLAAAKQAKSARP